MSTAKLCNALTQFSSDNKDALTYTRTSSVSLNWSCPLLCNFAVTNRCANNGPIISFVYSLK